MFGASSDKALAVRAAAGDRDAFARLIDRHYDRIHRISWRLMGDPGEAEDLAQEVCIALGRKIAGYRGEAAFTTWLYRVVVNTARDALRGRARRERLHRDWGEVEVLRRAGEANRAAEAEWLAGALGALTPELRETAVLVLEEGLGHRAAGEALGIAEGTVSWRMGEIRRNLKALAEEEANPAAGAGVAE